MGKRYGWAPWGFEPADRLADRTARARKPHDEPPDLLERGRHHGGPGISRCDDPHPREPLDAKRDEPLVRPERHEDVRSLCVHLAEPVGLVRRSRRETLHSADTVACLRPVSDAASVADAEHGQARHPLGPVPLLEDEIEGQRSPPSARARKSSRPRAELGHLLEFMPGSPRSAWARG